MNDPRTSTGASPSARGAGPRFASSGPQGRPLLRIALEGLRRAPRRMKLVLLFNVALIAFLAVTEIIDNLTSDVPQPYFRAASLVLLMSGAFILALASVLWTMSQEGTACHVLDLKLEAFRMRARRLDEILVAFPVMAFVAGCLVAAGIGMYVAVRTGFLGRGIILSVAVWFFLWAAAMIATTTRFLYTHAREQAEAAERARREATESQLSALQAQMNPHFLFNTLNTVASLVRTDAKAAEAMVENLAVVLRRTLDRSQRILSTVDDEVDYLAAYISLAQQRFENRLKVHWSIDPGARNLLVPTMTLQPLVENTLKHGIGARLEGGALHIGAHVEESAEGSGAGGATSRVGAAFPGAPGAAFPGAPGAASPGRPAAASPGAPAAAGRLAALVIEVADDGPGFPRRYREGTGLGNLRERLATLFGERAELEIDRTGPGSRVVIRLPAVSDADEVLDSVLSGETENDRPLTDAEIRDQVREAAAELRRRVRTHVAEQLTAAAERLANRGTPLGESRAGSTHDASASAEAAGSARHRGD